MLKQGRTQILVPWLLLCWLALAVFTPQHQLSHLAINPHLANLDLNQSSATETDNSAHLELCTLCIAAQDIEPPAPFTALSPNFGLFQAQLDAPETLPPLLLNPRYLARAPPIA